MTLATLFLASAITAGTLSGIAENWKKVGTSDDSPYKLFVNMADVVREGSARLFIAKMVPDVASNSDAPPDIASVLVLVKVDCSANTIETQSASMVDQSGKLSDLGGNPQRAIAPGTDDMTMKKMVCRGAQPFAIRRHLAGRPRSGSRRPASRL